VAVDVPVRSEDFDLASIGKLQDLAVIIVALT
jgi:hypothetical protein